MAEETNAQSETKAQTGAKAEKATPKKVATKKTAAKTSAKKAPVKKAATPKPSTKKAAAKKTPAKTTLPSGKVAIITRTKNRPLLLGRAIESAIQQTYEDWLMVIVNDGGEAGPVDELVEKYKDKLGKRIHVVHNPESLGMEGASNKGITSCESDYVIIHDDDDAWHPDFLAKTVDVLENDTRYQNLGGVVTYMELVYEEIKGNNVTEVRREKCRHWIPELTLWQMASGNLFAPISFLYKRSVFDTIGGMYRETLPVLGDWEFNLRFMVHYDIALIPEELSYYYHRVAGTNNNYSNTVVDGVDKHALYNQILRNELLREDIQNNQIGLGYLVNQAHTAHNHHKQVQQLYKLLAQIHGWLIKYLHPMVRGARKAQFWKK